MLNSQLIQPQILAALGGGGHSSKVLIADGNYPHSSKRGPNAQVVYLNLSPGIISACDALRALVSAVPIERAEVMDYTRTGPYAMSRDPEIWADFAAILNATNCRGELGRIERFKFYEAAASPDVILTIATAEQRIYANVLVTIGVVQ